MSDPHRITLSSHTVRNLVIVQSVLSGAAMLAGASQFADVAGVKYAGLVVVIVAATQQVVTVILARSVGQVAEQATEAVEAAGASAASAASATRSAAQEVASIHRDLGAGGARSPGRS